MRGHQNGAHGESGFFTATLRTLVFPLLCLGLLAAVGAPARAAGDAAGDAAPAPVALQADPGTAVAGSPDTRAYHLYLQADQARKQGNLDQAGSLLEQAAADPGSPSLLTELA